VEPIGKRDISLAVSKTILDAIKEGRFNPGDRLPPMKELCEELQVGISSVREGLIQLQSMGVVRIIQGKGTYLNENLDLKHFINSFKNIITLQRQDFFNTMEVRKIIECEAAKLAAERVSEDDIEKLSEILENMKDNFTQLDEYNRFDTEFHMKIAQCSNNPVLVMILESIQGLISNIIKEIANLPGKAVEGNKYHEGIYEAIKNRKPDIAYRKMREALAYTEEVARENLYNVVL
jgi:GntR family transcriptional repressor for pyruvate dehydrogenase complex